MAHMKLCSRTFPVLLICSVLVFLVLTHAWAAGAVQPVVSSTKARKDAKGLYGDDFVIAATSKDDVRPAVAWGDSRYLVVFAYAYSSTDYDIQGRFVLPSGAGAGSIVVDNTGTNTIHPDIAYSPAAAGYGRYLVVYERTLGTRTDVYGVLLNETGIVSEGPFLIAGDATTHAFSPAVVSAWDKFRVVWSEATSWSFDDADIYTCTVSGDGYVFPAKKVSGTATRSINPRITHVGHNYYLVVWQRAFSTVGDAEDWDWDILARVVEYDLSPVGSVTGLAGTILTEKGPDLAYNPSRTPTWPMATRPMATVSSWSRGRTSAASRVRTSTGDDTWTKFRFA